MGASFHKTNRIIMAEMKSLASMKYLKSEGDIQMIIKIIIILNMSIIK